MSSTFDSAKTRKLLIYLSIVAILAVLDLVPSFWCYASAASHWYKNGARAGTPEKIKFNACCKWALLGFGIYTLIQLHLATFTCLAGPLLQRFQFAPNVSVVALLAELCHVLHGVVLCMISVYGLQGTYYPENYISYAKRLRKWLSTWH